VQNEYMRLAERLWDGTEPLIAKPMKDRDIFDSWGSTDATPATNAAAS
jgi:light-independent protochlorophyllide reductase subunit L